MYHKKINGCAYHVLLIAFFVTLTLCFCGGSETSSGGNTGQEEQQEEQEEEPEILYSENFENTSSFLDGWYYMGGTDFTNNYGILHWTPGANSTSYCFNLFGGYFDINNVYIFTEIGSSINPTSISIYMASAFNDTECGDFSLWSTDGYLGVNCYFGDDANIYLYTASGSIQIQAYSAYTWYKAEFKNINYTNHTYDFYIDGVLRQSNVSFVSDQSNDVRFIALCNWDSADYYIDEIVMQK